MRQYSALGIRNKFLKAFLTIASAYSGHLFAGRGSQRIPKSIEPLGMTRNDFLEDLRDAERSLIDH